MALIENRTSAQWKELIVSRIRTSFPQIQTTQLVSGSMEDTLATIVSDKAAALSQDVFNATNSLNMFTATGYNLDRLASLFFVKRKPALAQIISIDVVRNGDPVTVSASTDIKIEGIPGINFRFAQDTVIANNTTTHALIAQQTGFIPVATGTNVTLPSSVTNLTSAKVKSIRRAGSPVEKDHNLRNRLMKNVSIRLLGTRDGLLAGLLNIDECNNAALGFVRGVPSLNSSGAYIYVSSSNTIELLNIARRYLPYHIASNISDAMNDNYNFTFVDNQSRVINSTPPYMPETYRCYFASFTYLPVGIRIEYIRKGSSSPSTVPATLDSTAITAIQNDIIDYIDEKEPTEYFILSEISLLAKRHMNDQYKIAKAVFMNPAINTVIPDGENDYMLPIPTTAVAYKFYSVNNIITITNEITS